LHGRFPALWCRELQLPLNGGVICGSPEVLFRLVVIKRKLGIWVVNLKFEGWFGWGSLVEILLVEDNPNDAEVVGWKIIWTCYRSIL